MENLKLSEKDIYILTKYKVYKDTQSGYYRLKIGDSYQYLHRFILNAGKGIIIDHIDRDKSNNKRENLRIATKSLNNYNRDVKSQHGRGIYFDKFGNRFRACISYKNKTLKLGSFKTARDAKEAYNSKAVEIYGESAELHNIN